MGIIRKIKSLLGIGKAIHIQIDFMDISDAIPRQRYKISSVNGLLIALNFAVNKINSWSCDPHYLYESVSQGDLDALQRGEVLIFSAVSSDEPDEGEEMRVRRIGV